MYVGSYAHSKRRILRIGAKYVDVLPCVPIVAESWRDRRLDYMQVVQLMVYFPDDRSVIELRKIALKISYSFYAN